MKKYFKSTLALVLSFAAITVVAQSARADHGNDFQCGVNFSQYIETVASNGFKVVNGRDMAAITLTAVKKKTNVQRVVAYNRWNATADVTNAFYYGATCEGVSGRLCEGMSVTACLPRGTTRVEISTDGSGSGRFEIRAGYR